MPIFYILYIYFTFTVFSLQPNIFNFYPYTSRRLKTSISLQLLLQSFTVLYNSYCNNYWEPMGSYGVNVPALYFTIF
jgi:hypothetical protein